MLPSHAPEEKEREEGQAEEKLQVCLGEMKDGVEQVEVLLWG